MKKLILLCFLLITFKNHSQEPNPDLFKTWYLHSITIDDVDYSPNDYGYYPDIQLNQTSEGVIFYIADPLNVSCSFEYVSFFTNPTSFQLPNSIVCLPLQTCLDGPEGPCSQIYCMHADYYYDTILTALNYTLTINEDETQTLTVTNENGDVAQYGSERLLSTTNFVATNLRVYPNPATEILFITSETDLIEKIAVYSINGKLVLSEKENVNQLDVSSLSNGLYFVEITSENGTAIQKFIKQ